MSLKSDGLWPEDQPVSDLEGAFSPAGRNPMVLMRQGRDESDDAFAARKRTKRLQYPVGADPVFIVLRDEGRRMLR